MDGIIDKEGQDTSEWIELRWLATLSTKGAGVDGNRVDLALGSILDRRNLVRARTSLAQLPLITAPWELRG